MLSHEEFKKTRKKLPFKKGTNKPLKIEEIIFFENKHKIRIPEQYRDFILSNNGVEPVLNQIEIKIGDEESGYFCIGCFVELKYSEVGDTENNYDEENNKVKPPKGLMNICYLDGDHPEIFINIEEGKNYGKIYYCEDRDPPYALIIRNSFDDLINNVLPWHEFEFEECCDCGDVERASHLIKNDYKYPDDTYKSLITQALESDYDMTEVIKLLINKENNQNNLKGIINRVKSKELIAELINKGININEIDENGNTALINWAISNKVIIKENELEDKISVIELLLKNGADINIKNKNGLNIWGVLNNQKEKFNRYPSRLEIISKIENIIKKNAVA